MPKEKMHIESFMGGDDMHDKMCASHFFIEANGFEKMTLWRTHEKEVHWKDLGVGFWQFVGYIDGKKRKPVCVSFHFTRIYGEWVCFFEPTSRYVDHKMIKTFIDKHFPDNDGKRSAKRICYASNFHDVMNYAKKI